MEINTDNQNNRKIKASFDNKKIILYQAFNKEIAEEALKLNYFGKKFNENRMTWIKPSFLWMMYRSKWGTEQNQERILSIEIRRTGFDTILSNAILSKYDNKVYSNQLEWKRQMKITEVLCQWDPERNVDGIKLPEKTIQLGIRGNILKHYISDWIIKINDITETVIQLRTKKNSEDIINLLPSEKVYPLDNVIKLKLGIKIS